MILRTRQHEIAFPRRPLVMGILNINDDSFSGDGTLDQSEALEKARKMIREGADIVDVGAESARTNRGVISVEEEVGRLMPFIEGFPDLIDEMEAEGHGRDESEIWPPLLSINTWRPAVVETVLPAGGDILNDIGGLPEGDDRNARDCASFGVALLIMHMIGLPKVPHTSQQYEDVVESVEAFFEDRIALAERAGVSRDHILLDPGLDFAKQRMDNLRLLKHLEVFHRFGRPLLIPVSRKTFIGETLGLPEPADRDAGTIGTLAVCAEAGAQIFRVHNVAAAVQALKTLEPVLASPAGP